MKKEYVPNIWKDKNSFYLKALDSDWYKLLVKLENLISVETTNFYCNEGMITMHFPVTTGSISSPMGKGSDSLPVSVDLFGIRTYLADSMQFMLEYGCRLTDKGVYYVMPSFRGEKADERHLCQFFHSESEIKGDLNDVMNLVDRYIKYLAKEVVNQLGEEIKNMVGDISHIEKIANYNGEFPRISFDDAETLLKEKDPVNIDKYIEYNDGWRNITRAGETKVMELFDGVVWITNYDLLAVPFYQKIDNDGKTAKNADLLMGIGETVGCGERHEDYNQLLESLEKHNVDESEYEWYVNMKKEFPLQTAGFGLGIERLLMWILKCDDIRNMQICLRFNGEEICM